MTIVYFNLKLINESRVDRIAIRDHLNCKIVLRQYLCEAFHLKLFLVLLVQINGPLVFLNDLHCGDRSYQAPDPRLE